MPASTSLRASGDGRWGGRRRAIGSVMPLPQPAEAPPAGSTSLWALWCVEGKHVGAYGCARAALSALLAQRGAARVWLPAYACTALAEAAAGLELRWIGIGADLRLDAVSLGGELARGDAVVGIDYFGRAPGADFLELVASRRDVLWVEDRAQAMHTGAPMWGDVALYSPRKLVGVGDGGLLVGDDPLPPEFGRPPPAPVAQTLRAEDPQDRHADRWFPAFQDQERRFGVDCGTMSPVTHRVLEGVAAEPLIAARQVNARRLAKALPDLALWPRETFEFAPTAFPIRVENRDAVAAALADEAIYCPVHWPDLPSDPAAFPAAHRLAGEMLSLPCDHRYGEADMARIVAALRRSGARGPR
jgi:dTDP-4-amino-4,6-dideoxygalactose transaminase